MNAQNPENCSMLELFRSEVETHAAAMSKALLALENDPKAVFHMEELMRSAHSIKGGARIVELDSAVRLAHTLEDCFVAVRKKGIQLNAEHMDILLQSTDMLVKLAETGEKAEDRSLSGFVNDLIAAITSIANPKEKSPQQAQGVYEDPQILQKSGENLFLAEKETASEKPASDMGEKIGTSDSQFRKPDLPEGPQSPAIKELPEAEQFPAKTEQSPVSDSCAEPDCETFSQTENAEPLPADTSSASLKITGQERTVRVTASKIERLMGLAGEVVVGARWLPPFTSSLLTLKRSQRDISLLLDEILKDISHQKEMKHVLSLCLQLREKIKDSGLEMAERISDIDMFTNVSAAISDRLYHEVIGVRMCPFSEGTQKYPRTVRDLARKLGKKASLEILGESTEVDRDILEKLDAPITHLLCNAVAHGIESPEKRLAEGKPETGTIRIEATHRAGMLMIIVSDDGAGIDPEELREEIIDRGKARPDIARHLSVPELMDFLFLPGFSTAKDVTEIAGRGVGLDVVHSTVHEVGGVIRVSSVPGRGMRFHMELPLTLSVIRTFLVEIAEEPYAFPLARIDSCLRVKRADIQVVEDRQYFRFDENNIALVDIREVLELPASDVKRDTVNVVAVSDRSHSYGMVVDRFLGECDLVVRPLDPRLGKIPDISAAAVMMDGSPVLIFDVEDMVHSIGGLLSGKNRLSRVDSGTEDEDRPMPKRILVVEDSFIVREKERKILENKGYEVDVAVDGQDGWNCLRTAAYDMVVTDIDMPRMNGFELIRNIRQHTELASLPVVVVSYKASDDDRLQGLKAGANYYLTKTDFDDNSLIEAVTALIGEA